MTRDEYLATCTNCGSAEVYQEIVQLYEVNEPCEPAGDTHELGEYYCGNCKASCDIVWTTSTLELETIKPNADHTE